jgi:simple sugar transport system ATP-binding protein
MSERASRYEPRVPAGPPLLAAVRISKRFGALLALDDVSFDVLAGTVTCLLGDNGAGKSTLIKVLAGVYQPDAGRLLLDGREVRFDSPRAALAHGIATVHQDLALIPLLSVWRSSSSARRPPRPGGVRRLDGPYCRRTACGWRAGIPSPMPAAQATPRRATPAVPLPRAHRARVLILDEPTPRSRRAAHSCSAGARRKDRGVGVS